MYVLRVRIVGFKHRVCMRVQQQEQGDAFLRGERADADFSGQGGWLRGRRHPFTGQPLRTERLTLPPGKYAPPCLVLAW